ncbi:MAG: sensor histidine kinase, partial [Acidimicrobiales bacterium]
AGAGGAAAQAQGPSVPVAVSAGEVRGQGGATAGGVFVIRDLRQEREIERMKSEFLSRVGHELRTPLTGIMGFTDLLGRTDVAPERARAWQGEILEQSKRLLRTVEMLEFFASAGAGRVRLRREGLDARSLVGDVAGRWSSQVSGSHTVVGEVAGDLPQVLADRRWLTLALDELVDNAVKFSPEGGEVTVRVDPGPGMGWVEISVTDQGKGMSEEEGERAFADFMQGDGSDTRRYGGLGLGLSLVQRVAQSHGGRVTWDSQPGRGSRFSIGLPVATAEPAVAPQP